MMPDAVSSASPRPVKDLGEINGRIANGAAWMVSFKLIDRGLGLATTIILARLLLPSDFGLVAMATAMIAVLELFGAFSFDVSLIQNTDARRQHFDTAWTLNVIVAMCCGVGLALLAKPAVAFFSEPRLENVIYVLAVGSALQGLENIGTVAFRRELRFDREFKFLFAKRLASVAITIPLALWLVSYWALVMGQLGGKIISVALSYYVSAYRPRFCMAARGHLFHFSKWMMATNTIVLMYNRLADVLIGKLAGAEALGIYSISYEVSNLPTTELVAPINRAAFPGYSLLSGDLNKLKESFLGVIAMLALFVLPAGIGITMLADLVVPAILGWKWLAAIPLIQVLAIGGVIIAVQSNMSAVYLAIGSPRINTIVSAIQLVFLVILLVPATLQYGAIGAAWAAVGTAILVAPVNQAIIARQLQISVLEFGAQLYRPVVASLTMAAAIYSVKAGMSLPHDALLYFTGMLLCVFVGIVVYASILYVLWRFAGCPDGAEAACLARIRQIARRFSEVTL